MIPVLGCPILNGSAMLRKMLASIDHPIRQTVIVDNGGVVPPDIDAIRLPHNIGVAASWNLILQVTPRAPWWLIVNHDIEFAPGDLAALAVTVDPNAAAIWQLEGYSAFAITGRAIDRIGLFDINLHPGYYEDNDLEWRARIAGLDLIPLPAQVKHTGSATINLDPFYREQNNRTFPNNGTYYTTKWGGPPGHEVYRTPFDAGGDIRDIRVDFGRLRSLAWKPTTRKEPPWPPQ